MSNQVPEEQDHGTINNVSGIGSTPAPTTSSNMSKMPETDPAQAEHADVDARVNQASENLHSEPESDAEEAIKAMDDQHKEIMTHIMDASISHMVRDEATAAAMVAAGLTNPNIHEDKKSLTHKILNTHREVEARSHLTAACALMRLAGKTVTAEEVKTYDGLARALINDNLGNFEESFSKSVDDTVEKMEESGAPEIAIATSNGARPANPAPATPHNDEGGAA